jgi:hypothetical protein
MNRKLPHITSPVLRIMKAVTVGIPLPGPSVTMQIGITRAFCKTDIADQGLLEGWSDSEEGHTWNDGRTPTLHMWTKSRPSFPCGLTLEGRPYLAEGCRHQTMTLYGNGYRLGSWWLSDSRPQKLTCVIEPEQWLPRSSGALLKLVWVLPDSRKPFEIEYTQDHRLLGFCFHSLTLNSGEGLEPDQVVSEGEDVLF